LAVKNGLKNIKISLDNGNNVYYIKNEQLIRYDWLLKKEEVLLPYTPIDYLIYNNQLYFLNNESLNSTILKMIDLNKNSEPEIITFMERGNYQLSKINNHFLTIQDKNDQELLVMSIKDKSSEVIKRVKYYQWSETGTEMIFGNDYELWVYRPMAKTSRYILFTRVSNPITAVDWYPVESHLFYIEGGLMKTVENIERDGLIFNLGEFGEADKLFVNKAGDKIFFTGTVGKTVGLYEVEIQ